MTEDSTRVAITPETACGPRRVEIDRPQDLHYWTRELGVPERVLRNTVQLVGSLEAAVRRALDSDRWLLR